MRHILYCEYDFLVGFFDNRPKVGAEETFSEDNQMEIWRKYCSLFLENPNIYLNISADDFYNKKPPHKFIDKLKKKKGDGEIKIKFDKFPEKFNSTNEISKHALFFLFDSKKSRQLEEDYGMLFISNANIYQKAKYLFSSDCFCKIDNSTDWHVLKKYKHPCNYLLLIDNFILKKENICRKNLTTIFDALLPQKLKQSFSVEIRTKKPVKKDNNAWEDWKDRVDCNDWELKITDYFKDIIHEVRKEEDLPIQVTFKEIKYSEHDRHLITNYYWLPCGYGYVLTDEEKQKGTDVHIHRITQPNVLERMDEFITKNTK
jgi:hypothetical protein